jgi:hypothetical protein
MPKQHGGLPLTWNDTASPSFGQGVGAASPTLTDLCGTAPGAIRVQVFNENTEDRLHNVTQILHNIYIPSSGNVTFKPHVHFTFVSEPTTAQTVVWTYSYVYAKVGPTATTAGQYASSPSTVSATYTCTSDTEIRKGLVLSLGDVTIAASDCGPSMIFIGTTYLSTTSTISNGVVALVSFDIHYQQGPVGTDNEFS